MPDNVITLVHGTFARKTDWISPDGPFARALAERVEGDMAIREFRWSGGNSHRARLSAGGALREQLLRQASAHPKARHYVIAHSHGGNVAAYATRNWPLATPAPKAVFCLATPFLEVSLIRTGVMLFVITATVFLSAVLWGVIVGALMGDSEAGIWLVPLSVVFVMAMTATVGYGLYRGAQRATRRMEQINIDFAGHDVHLVSMRLRFDEARGWLAVLLRVAKWPSQLSSFAARVLNHEAWLIYAVLIVPMVLVGAAAALEHTAPELASILGISGAGLMLAAMLVYLLGPVIFLLAGIATWFARGMVYSIGESILDSFFLTTSLTPDVVSGVSIQAGTRLRDGLRHSQIYLMDETREVIADHINAWHLHFGASPRALRERSANLAQQQQRLGAD